MPRTRASGEGGPGVGVACRRSSGASAGSVTANFLGHGRDAGGAGFIGWRLYRRPNSKGSQNRCRCYFTLRALTTPRGSGKPLRLETSDLHYRLLGVSPASDCQTVACALLAAPSGSPTKRGISATKRSEQGRLLLRSSLQPAQRRKNGRQFGLIESRLIAFREAKRAEMALPDLTCLAANGVGRTALLAAGGAPGQPRVREQPLR